MIDTAIALSALTVSYGLISYSLSSRCFQRLFSFFDDKANLPRAWLRRSHLAAVYPEQDTQSSELQMGSTTLWAVCPIQAIFSVSTIA